MNMKAKSKQDASKKKKKSKHGQVSDGIIHVQASFNNTIVTVTDRQGDVIAWRTAGQDFKGSRKSTPYAAQIAAGHAFTVAKSEYGLKSVDVKVSGPGAGKEAVIRQAISDGLKITSITDTTGIPHNGCKPPKKRRV
jgi:small subunit ribosomal protein S11